MKVELKPCMGQLKGGNMAERIKGCCKRHGCAYRARDGVCDYILITGRPRGCDIKGCIKYAAGPKKKSKSVWIGSVDCYGEAERI